MKKLRLYLLLATIPILVGIYSLAILTRSRTSSSHDWPSFEMTARHEGYGVGPNGQYGIQRGNLAYEDKYHWSTVDPKTGVKTVKVFHSDPYEAPGLYGSPGYIARLLTLPNVTVTDTVQPLGLIVTGTGVSAYKTLVMTSLTDCPINEDVLKSGGLKGLGPCSASGKRMERLETTFVVFENQTQMNVLHDYFLDGVFVGRYAVETLILT